MIDPRSVASMGLGFGPMHVALLGFVATDVSPPDPTPTPIGGGWPFPQSFQAPKPKTQKRKPRTAFVSALAEQASPSATGLGSSPAVATCAATGQALECVAAAGGAFGLAEGVAAAQRAIVLGGAPIASASWASIGAPAGHVVASGLASGLAAAGSWSRGEALCWSVAGSLGASHAEAGVSHVVALALPPVASVEATPALEPASAVELPLAPEALELPIAAKATSAAARPAAQPGEVRFDLLAVGVIELDVTPAIPVRLDIAVAGAVRLSVCPPPPVCLAVTAAGPVRICLGAASPVRLDLTAKPQPPKRGRR